MNTSIWFTTGNVKTLAVFIESAIVYVCDFEKLEVYSKAKIFNRQIQKFLLKGTLDNAYGTRLHTRMVAVILISILNSTIQFSDLNESPQAERQFLVQAEMVQLFRLPGYYQYFHIYKF